MRVAGARPAAPVEPGPAPRPITADYVNFDRPGPERRNTAGAVSAWSTPSSAMPATCGARWRSDSGGSQFFICGDAAVEHPFGLRPRPLRWSRRPGRQRPDPGARRPSIGFRAALAPPRR